MIRQTVHVPELDAAKIIDDIVRKGITLAEIARRINVPYSTVERWANGSSPRWHHGQALIALHFFAMGL